MDTRGTTRRSRARWAWTAGAVLVLAACGGSGDDDAGSGDGNIIDTDPDDVSGPVGGEGVGTTLSIENGTTATYRGAVVQRADTTDPANPVRTTVFAAFDVSLPDGEREFFSFDGFVNTARALPLLSVDVSPLEPCENPASPLPGYNFGRELRPREFTIEGPVTLTFVHCFSRAGSAIPVEELAVSARLLSSDVSDRATLAIPGAPMEEDALDDVESSIAWLHDHVDPTSLYIDGRSEWEPNVFGQTTFDEYYGDGLESFDTVGERAPGADAAPEEGVGEVPDPGATIAPPPTVPDAATIDAVRAQGFDDGYADGYASGSTGEDHYLASYDDPDPSLGEYDVAYDDGFDTGFGDGEASVAPGEPDEPAAPDEDPENDTDEETDEGAPTPAPSAEYPEAYGPADDDFAEFEVVRSIVEGMQTEAYEFQDCAVTPAGYPCIDVRAHTHADGRDHRMVVSVRLGPGTEQFDRDLWLLITNADPVTDPWIVVEDWWVDDGDQPGWAM